MSGLSFFHPRDRAAGTKTALRTPRPVPRHPRAGASRRRQRLNAMVASAMVQRLAKCGSEGVACDLCYVNLTAIVIARIRNGAA